MYIYMIKKERIDSDTGLIMLYRVLGGNLSLGIAGGDSRPCYESFLKIGN